MHSCFLCLEILSATKMDKKGMAAFKQRQLAALSMVASTKSEASRHKAASRPGATPGEPRHKKPKPTATSASHKSSSSHHKPRPKHSYEYDRQMSIRFSVLAKVVKYLRTRFHEGLLEPLNIEDLLEEAHLIDTPATVKGWLASEALPKNPKVETIRKGGSNCFMFRPRYPKVRDRHSLINLLQSYSDEGEGGVLLEDLLESAPNALTLVNALVESADAIAIPLPNQRKLNTTATSTAKEGEAGASVAAKSNERLTNRVVFSSQRQYGLSGVDEKLIAMWRAIEPGGAEMASALAGEQLPEKVKGKGKRGRPKTVKTAADGFGFRQTNVHLANKGVLMNFDK